MNEYLFFTRYFTIRPIAFSRHEAQKVLQLFRNQQKNTGKQTYLLYLCTTLLYSVKHMLHSILFDMTKRNFRLYDIIRI